MTVHIKHQVTFHTIKIRSNIKHQSLHANRTPGHLLTRFFRLLLARLFLPRLPVSPLQRLTTWVLLRSSYAKSAKSQHLGLTVQFLLRQAFADDEASTRLLQILLFLLLSTASLMFIPCAIRSSFLSC